MVQLVSVTALGSALIGMSNAAALGSKEDYDSGAVHHKIMGIKMVCTRRSLWTG
jgi:hypothetical protein